jgi:hypothetical protein
VTQVNASIDDEILKRFRHVVYTSSGLKKGDLKKALELAMLDYIEKYSDPKTMKDIIKKARAHNSK